VRKSVRYAGQMLRCGGKLGYHPAVDGTNSPNLHISPISSATAPCVALPRSVGSQRRIAPERGTDGVLSTGAPAAASMQSYCGGAAFRRRKAHCGAPYFKWLTKHRENYTGADLWSRRTTASLRRPRQLPIRRTAALLYSGAQDRYTSMCISLRKTVRYAS